MQTSKGAQKSKATNLANDPDYYSNLGKLNKGKKKAKLTGFQLLTKEERSKRSREAARIRWAKKKTP